MCGKMQEDLFAAIALTALNYLCLLVHRIDSLRQGESSFRITLDSLNGMLLLDTTLSSRLFIIFMLNIFYMFSIEGRFRGKITNLGQCGIFIIPCLLLPSYRDSLYRMPVVEAMLFGLTIVYVSFSLKRFRYSRASGTNGLFAVAIVPIYINCYSGLYLTWSKLFVYDIIGGIVGLLVVLLSIYAIYVENLYEKRVFYGCIIMMVLIVLLAAYSEYRMTPSEIAYTPIDKPWRSLYFVLVLSYYLVVPCLWGTRFSSCAVIKNFEHAFKISSLAICVVPLLFCFTTHGCLLMVLSGIWIIVVNIYSVRLYRAVPADKGRLFRYGLIASMIMVLVLILIIDRVFYYPLSKMLAPSFVMVKYVASIYVSSGFLVTLLFSFNIKMLKRLWWEVDSACRIILKVCTFSLLVSFFFAFAHSVREYSLEVIKNADTSMALMPVIVSGFNWFNSLSWAFVCYAIYLFAILLNEVSYFGKKFVRVVEKGDF
mgnify:CR=1 FL=1